MTCFFCKGAMRADSTTHFAQFGNCIVIVKNVPCSMCTQCGEVLYSGTVTKRLVEITAEFERFHAEFAVIYYSA
jgi:YgiT-type zinc finger domain-containing protein